MRTWEHGRNCHCETEGRNNPENKQRKFFLVSPQSLGEDCSETKIIYMLFVDL
jgi:hypothetical protein